MAITIPTSDDVRQAFQQALGLGHTAHEANIKDEYERLETEALNTPGHQWEDVGVGVGVLDAANDIRLRLVRIAWKHTVYADKAWEVERLKKGSAALKAEIASLVPQGSPIRFRLIQAPVKQVPFGAEFEFLATGIVNLNVPADILKFLRAKKWFALSGNQIASGSDMVAFSRDNFREQMHNYELWNVEVQRLECPTDTPRTITVDRPTRAGLSMTAIGLDDED